MKKSILALTLMTVFLATGCEKLSNSAKNIQSDWVGLDRKIEIYSCHTGQLLKSYQGSVRLNPDDKVTGATSFLVDGKKLHTNLCYVVSEIGLKEELK
ncbi:hypothetical protein CYQ88_06445 [Hydrogenovibrio sp. SC-1]|uniref:hypothetical protein n=1 Tax=Hydrogenovibrio sp. SC-1 TaxID=2065820 RepID=UPI000C7B163F|nr:hypothetical protein [Hydrogenovibrio sp. SC-1]PLA74324.1 hypothetical protein CYQ88_06445 [Hydrogenovibrio sp. SC-1]